MSVFKNMMFLLGLGADDEEYGDDYLADEGYTETQRPEEARAAEAPHGPASYQRPGDTRPVTSARSTFGTSQNSADRPSAVGAVRPLRAVPEVETEAADPRTDVSAARVATDQESRVRAVPMHRSKPRALNPQSFGDAKTIADELKKSVPVIMNLRGLDRDLGRRLIDFASGACYCIGGKMEKIAPQVFLLIPRSVEVSDDDRRRIDERGFDRD